MKKIRPFFLTALLATGLSAKTQKQSHPHILEIKSPQAAQIDRLAMVATSLHTGQATPSIGIYEIKTPELSIPIGLGYSNTGLKIGETPTWVGHGWHLSGASFMIGQSVKGIPDDSPAGLAHAANNIDLLRYLNQQMGAQERLNYENAVAALERDSERDIFNFSFLGHEGSFYFDANGHIRSFVRNDLKISYSFPTGFFTIVDERGIRYEFGCKETTAFSQDEVTSNNPIVVNGNTWYLTKIVTPLQDEVTFTYSDARTFNEIGTSYSLTFGAIASHQNQYGHSICQQDNSLTNVQMAQVFGSATEKLLTQITARHVKVLFNTLPIREDLTYVGSSQQVGGKGRALNEIIVMTPAGQVVQKTQFSYGHFLGQGFQPNNRLKLQKVATMGGGDTLAHRFAYYNENSDFPPLGLQSKDYDHWGYYNGAYNSATVPSFNAALVSGFVGNYNGADKNANAHFSRYGMLKEIMYPTGGKALFEYEANRVNLGNNGLPLFIVPPANANTANFEVGGNRLKQITYYDYEGHEAQRQYFDYGPAQLRYIPNYLSPKERMKEDFPGIFVSCGPFWVVNDRPVNSMPGFHLEYELVTEKDEANGANGHTQTHFGKTEHIGGSEYPFPTIVNTNWRGGIPQAVTRYRRTAANTDEPVSKNVSAYFSTFSHPMSLLGTSLKLSLHQISGMNSTSTSFGSRFVSAIYTYFTEDFRQTASTAQQYTPSGILTQSTAYEYGNSGHTQVTRQTVQDSRGHTEATAFRYPSDFVGNPVYDSMVARNMVATVVEQTLRNDTKGQELERGKTNFQLQSGSGPALPATVQKALLGGPLQTELTITAYDAKGNILESMGRDGIVTAYLWGYDGQYPVAKITNCTYAQAVTQSGIDLNMLHNPGSDAALRTELQKLRMLPNALVHTYTYAPLVGMTSETDPNGNTVYYEYDALLRLKVLRDRNGHILKKMDYRYGQ